MKKTNLVFFCLLLGVTVNVHALGGWHDWNSLKMSSLTKTNCTIQYSKAAAFQDSSLLVNYTAGASLTFPYNYTSSLTAGCNFFMPFLDLSSTHTQDTIKVEFLLSGVVKATIKMAGRKPGWNTIQLQQTNGVVLNGYDSFTMTGLIPDKPTQIRINFPNNTGSVYLGKVLLCDNTTWSTLQMMSFDARTAECFAADAFTQPDAPTSVSSSQITDLQKIATAMDEVWGVSTLAQIANIPTATMTDIQTRYDSWKIVRNGNIVNGNNRWMYFLTTDVSDASQVFSNLAMDIAINYRNTQSATEKASLLAKFYDVFDFGVFMGGQIYQAWNDGVGFALAIYLMRDELKATDRITPVLLSDLKRLNGFKRVFINESYMCKYQPLLASRKYTTGELGEDLDFMRLVSWRFIMISLLNTTVNEQVRDMSACSNYFSNIVFQYSPSAIDGLKPDGTPNHHVGWIDLYGVSTIDEMAKVVYALSHTSFQVSYPAYSLMYDMVKSQDFRSYHSIIPQWLTNKTGVPSGGKYADSPGRYALMALSYNYNGNSAPDAFMAQTYLRIINSNDMGGAYTYTPFETKATTQLNQLGYTANAMPEGNKTYSYGTAFIHRRADWLVLLKTASRYQYVYETTEPFITYLAHGVISVVNSMFQRFSTTKMIVSDLYSTGYDWRKLPGATTVDFTNIQSMVNKEVGHIWPNTSFVGGVSQSGNGVFTDAVVGSILNGLGSFGANKSYFCFDNLVVCVGSNISNQVTGQNTITTLFQDKITTTDATYNNSSTAITSIPYTYDNTATAASVWLMDSHNTGYWLPSDANISVRRQSQTNPNWTNSGNDTGTFALAWLNHGIAPQAKSYWYLMDINCTPTTMTNFNTSMQSSTPPVKLLANTSNLQMVEYPAAKQYAGVVINSFSAINLKDISTVSIPCTFMVQDSLSFKKLAVSYPDLDFIQTSTPSTTWDTWFGNNLYWGYSASHTALLKLIGDWDIAVAQPNVTVLSRTTPGFTSLNVQMKDGLPTNVLLKPLGASAISNIASDDSNIKVWIENEVAVISKINDALNLNSRGKIVNVSGVTVKRFETQSSLTKVPIGDLVPGVYMVCIENTAQITKFIKN
ncbi:MAG: polysaccharide lyase family 8 super-sandwich domain-containing protein [Paludibacter sp.]